LLIATLLVFAASGLGVRRMLDRDQSHGGELRIQPPARPPGTFGAVTMQSWDVFDRGQDSYQVVFPDRKPGDIEPPPLGKCYELMDWARQQGGVMVGKV